MQEMPAVYPDRIIMVRGPVANMSQAEAAISVILRECMEKNIRISVRKHSIFPFLVMFPAVYEMGYSRSVYVIVIFTNVLSPVASRDALEM
jgi:hypothetical protein